MIQLDTREDLLAVLAILLVIVSMAGVDVLIINEPLRAVTVLPISLVLLLWGAAVMRLRGERDVR